MHRTTRLAASIGAAFGLTLLAANPALAEETQQLERITVTGSSIKRLAAETASPVQIISRQDIKNTGANTVRQVLDTVTATAGELRDDGNGGSFAAGASGVNLRGLGKGATLVLMNGRRLANYGLADGGKESFVNIDSIPADAVERIEVLKDGASAIYGSDAMAGVINLIMRSEYRGVGLSGSYQSGISPRLGKQGLAGIVAGMGDLDKDRFNVFGNVEFYKREGYMQADVMGSYPEWHKRLVSPAFGDPSLVSYPGNYIVGSSRVPNPACTTKNSAGSCVTDLTHINQFSDPAERVNAIVMGRVALGNSLELFADLSYSHTKTDYLSLPIGINSPATPTRWFDGNAGVIRTYPKPRIPNPLPGAPAGSTVGLEYRFMDANMNWEQPAEANQYRAMTGLKGTFKDWDWEVAMGRVGANAEKNTISQYAPEFNKAIESGEYKIGGTNSDALLARMFHSAVLRGTNYQNFVDGKVTGEIARLPAGPLQAAFGTEYRQESMKIKSGQDVLDAQLVGRGGLWVEGERKLGAFYTELEGPVVKGLTLTGALRADKATGFDAHVSPKLGLRWELTPQFLLRGTAAGGFRAPTIPETQGKIGLTGFFNGTFDPKRCDTATAVRDILRTGDANDRQEATLAYNSGCSVSVPAMISSNKDLKPELSRSLTLGFVVEPVKNWSVAMDYYKVERRDEIAYRDPDYVLAREGDAAYSKLVARAPISAQDQIWINRANTLKPGANLSWSNGQLITLLLQYENFGKTETSGIDLDVAGRIDAGEFGVVRLGLSADYKLTRREWDIDANSYRPNRVGNRGEPRIKAQATGNWTYGNWAYGVRFNYTSATNLNNDETDASVWGPQACQASIKPGDLPCMISSDLTTTLGLTYKGFKGLTLQATLGNATNEDGLVNLRDGYTFRTRTLKLGFEYKF